jgi:hypothetical protein
MRKRTVFVVFAILLIFGLVSCGPKAPQPEYSPQEIAERNAATWLHIWNSQFEDHVAMSKMSNLTDGQKEILNKKADLLTQSKPILDVYASAVKQGITPSATTEQELMMLMNQLSQMALMFTPQ